MVFKNGKVTDLGTLPGGDESQAISINDLGLVSGFASNGTEDPFSMFGWGTQARSFVWQDGVMKDIGTLGGPDALVATMNTRGQIAGQSYTDSTPNDTTGTPTTHPFLWERGRMRDLGTLGGTLGFANWMNDSGVVVGISSLAGDETGHPFLWNGKQMLDLGTLDGGDFGAALYVNDPGHATGFSYRSDGTYHAFLWANGRMRDPPPPAGAPCSAGFAINDRDDVVGEASDCQGNNLAPILWHKGIPYDLSTLIAPTNLRLDEPEYISDEGEIVGHGFLPNGDIHEFMLVPNPQAVLTAVASTSKLRVASAPIAGTRLAERPRAAFASTFPPFLSQRSTADGTRLRKETGDEESRHFPRSRNDAHVRCRHHCSDDIGGGDRPRDHHDPVLGERRPRRLPPGHHRRRAWDGGHQLPERRDNDRLPRPRHRRRPRTDRLERRHLQSHSVHRPLLVQRRRQGRDRRVQHDACRLGRHVRGRRRVAACGARSTRSSARLWQTACSGSRSSAATSTSLATVE